MTDKFSHVGLGDAIYEILVLPYKAAEAIEKGDVVKVSAHVDDALPTIAKGTDAATTVVGVAMQDIASGAVGEVLVIGVAKVTAGAGGVTVGEEIEAAADGEAEAGATAGKVIGYGLQTFTHGDTGIVFIGPGRA